MDAGFAVVSPLLAVATHRDWIDWAVVILTFAFAAIAIAVWQSIRSGRIATAASQAIARAEKQLTANDLIDMSSQLEQAELEFERAASSDDKGRVLELLIRWRRSANQLIGMVDQRADRDPELVASLRNLVTLAQLSQANLSDGRFNLKSQTKQVRAAIADATGHLSRYAGKLKTSATGGT